MSLKINFAGLPPHLSTEALEYSVEEAFQRFHNIAHGAESAFFQLPFQTEHLEACRQIHRRFKNRKHFLHLGVGGSSLGAEMLISALAKPSSPHFEFINNVDPDTLTRQISHLNWDETLIYVVSKSGNTPETLATLAAIEQQLIDAGINPQIVVATEPGEGKLGRWADKRGIPRLPLPPQVGGRYSVLTPVGLLPALFAGLDGRELLRGAASLTSRLLAPLPHNELVKTAVSLVALKKGGITQTVFMPYSGRLKQLSFWFTQLWAESLGKKVDRRGEIVYTGLTPIPAWGTTDQHGQMQLFMEGPLDKLILLLEVASFETDFPLASHFPKLEGRRLSELMPIQLAATKKALTHAQRPWLSLSIDRVDEFHLGELILFLESLTVMVGCIWNIDPFDQPGVEKGKEYAREAWQS